MHYADNKIREIQPSRMKNTEMPWDHHEPYKRTITDIKNNFTHEDTFYGVNVIQEMTANTEQPPRNTHTHTHIEKAAAKTCSQNSAHAVTKDPIESSF